MSSDFSVYPVLVESLSGTGELTPVARPLGIGSFSLDREQFGDRVLLGRMEGDVPGYLSYSVEEGEVLCVFRSVVQAEEFYGRWQLQIPGEGWGAVVPSSEELVGILGNFDLVSVSPQPVPGTTEYLLPAEDLARRIRETG